MAAENIYAKTYGKTTFLSSVGGHHSGFDLPPELRYQSTIKDEFKNPKEQKSGELDR